MDVSELTALRADLVGALARVDHLLAAYGTEKEAASPRPRLTAMHRTVAVETVLAGSEGPMRPVEIWEHLRAGGRTDPKMEVQVTTFDLWQRGRIGKVGRGLYVSTPDARRAS
jgi:hypothetical protein